MTDICIILEGTYPYKTGGVGTWTDLLIRGLPQFSFSIVHIYAGKLPALAVYSLPPNVRSVVTIPLTTRKRSVSISHLLARVPEARCYHALSTGLAGLIGAEMKRRRGSPFLLTEHGIYWHEIAQGVDELECGFKMIELEGSSLDLGASWQGWLAAFKDLAADAYRTCDELTTVCAFNKELQISLDASATKCRVIQNAVHPQLYERFRIPDRPRDPASVALVGRVTKLKDIRTFIEACGLIRNSGAPATFSVFGPTDQDPQYYNQCVEWRNEKGLQDLRFEGYHPPSGIYPSIDLLVSSSVSEAQPFVLLEAMASGIPVIATSVGDCPTMLGNGGKDASGICVAPGDAEGIATAVIRILNDRELYRALSMNGIRRAERNHDPKVMLDPYRQLYETLTAGRETMLPLRKKAHE